MVEDPMKEKEPWLHLLIRALQRRAFRFLTQSQ